MNEQEYSITHNNHYKLGYNDNFERFRKSPNDEWRIEHGTISREPKSWRVECINSAKLIRDTVDGTLWIFLSGGIDSEAMLLSFYLAGIPVSIAIIRFENNYNAHDILFAVNLCEQLGLKYQFFDVNVIELWEEKFWPEYSKFQMISLMPVSTMHIIDNYIDGVPIIGMGEAYITRTTCTNDFYSGYFEYETTYDKFFNYRKRLGVSSFFQYTPEQVLSFFYSNQVDQFLKTAKKIKLGYFTPWKWLVYNEHFPEIKPRLKNHGYEILDGLTLNYRKEIKEQLMDFNSQIYFPYEEYIKTLRGNL